jgi:hypothetical protein
MSTTPPALIKSFTNYSTVLDRVIDAARTGIAKGHSPEKVAAYLTHELNKMDDLTPRKAVGLLAVAAVRLAK